MVGFDAFSIIGPSSDNNSGEDLGMHIGFFMNRSFLNHRYVDTLPV